MEVNVNIVTKQYDENSNIDNINLDVVGKLYIKNNETYVVYKESSEGIETVTTLKISNDEVSIKRFGSSNTTMVFRKNFKNTTKYKTPQGLFIIETDTKELDIENIEENMFKIYIKYDINIMEIFKGRNEISILIGNKE